MQEDKDPFAEFGGSAIETKPTQQTDDPFAEFGGVAIEKKNGGNEQSQPLQQRTEPSATPTTTVDEKIVTPTPEGYMVKEVEVVGEKPSEATKVKSAFMRGIKSYTDNSIDYDILASNVPKERKIELLEKRRSEQLPQQEQNIFQTGAEIIGGSGIGMLKSIGAGIAAAPASPIASVVAATGVAMGDGYRQGFTGAFKEAYYQAIEEGKTPDQAIDIAQQVAQTGGIGGVAEGAMGALPITRVASIPFKSGSKLLKKGIEFALDATIDAGTAGGAQLATNVEAQKQGLKRELTSGVAENVAGELLFTAGTQASQPVINYISKSTIGKLYTKGVDKADKKDAVTIAATQPIEVSQAAAQEAVKQGAITEQEAAEITQDVINRKKALNAMPSNMTLDEQNDMAEIIEQRQKLESEMEKVSDAVKPIVQMQIDQLDKSIAIPLPPKYMDSAGENTSELKDGQLYITRKGDVRMWDAAQKQFLEAPRTFEVEPKKETDAATTTAVGEPIQQTATEATTKAEEGVAETVSESVVEDSGVGAEATVADVENQATPLQTQPESQVIPEQNPALANVEATAKALDELTKKKKTAATETKTKVIGEEIVEGTDVTSETLGITQKISEGFNKAGEQSKTEQSPKALGEWLIANAQTGDRIVVNEDEYWVVERKIDKKGNTEIELQQYFRNDKNEFENNPSAVKLFNSKHLGTETAKLATRDASDLFENSYRNSNGEVVVERSTYIPQSKNSKAISEAYHKAKADGSNPELVKAVEELLNKQNDSQNKSGVSSEVGTRQEPIQVEPIQEGSATEVSGGGILQAEGGEVVAKQPIEAPSITAPPIVTIKQEQIDATKDEVLKQTLADEEVRIRRASEKLMQADMVKGEFADNVSDYKESVIADNMGRITEESFNAVGDRNYVNDSIRKSYFAKANAKIKTTIDQLAKEMSDLVGIEITEQDIYDFIVKYPNGVGLGKTKKEGTFYGENNTASRRAELLADAEAILGYELDEEGMERFYQESKNLQEAIDDINVKPISDKDADALAKEYDEYLNNLTDEQRKRELAKAAIEGEQVVEGAEDANRKAIQERDARQQEAERAAEKAKQEPVVESAETIDDRIAKKLAELKERKKGKLYSGLDFENLDLYTELAYLYIRKGVKNAADFAKEIGEELTYAIKKAWDAANANVKKETENFSKWKDYAKRQFEAEEGGLNFQEFKERFNKRFNVAADDVALVEVFSEAQSEYNAERGKSVSKREVDKSFKPERKKVEVDEKAALKDQIRLEVKAAREGFRGAKKEQFEFAQRIKDFLDNNKIAKTLKPTQIKALINRAASVKNEAQLDKFLDYAQKVIDDANFVEEMQKVSDLQKRARRRNHTSFNSAVKEFATIKPEDIPSDKLPDYIAALNDLANGVPNYKKMQEMFYDITQFKRQPKPFENVKTFNEAEDALKKALSTKIDTIEDYKELLKNIRAFNKRVNQLFEDGTITEQERNDLLDALAKDRKAFDAKFGADVDRLKTDLIKDALAVQSTQEYKDAVADIKSPTDKELLFEFSAIKPADLKRLPPEMLSDLADILQNVADGFVDHYRLRDIVSEANALRNAEAVARQVEAKSPSVENVNAKLNELAKEEVAFREGELGLGRKKAGALTKYIYDPLISAIEKANRQTQLGVNELKSIFGNQNKQSRLRMGIVANMLQEYMAQYNPKFSKVENIGNRDWVKDVFDKKLQSRFKDEKEAKEVLKAWESLVGDKLESGKSLSPKELYDSFMANDGKYLTKEEGAALAKWFKYAEDVNADKQKASNEMRGKEFNAQPFYAPRIRRDGDATIDDDTYDVAIDSKTNRISIKSPFGESRTSQEVEALNYDIVETAEKAISNANRDYELTKAMQEVNRTINAATNKKTSDVMAVVAKDVKESLVRQYGNTLKSDPIRKLQNLRSTLVQLNPLKTVKEFVATLSSMPTRGGEPLGYIELFKRGGMKDILEFTGSPLAERLNVNQQFQLTEGEIKSMSPMQKAAYYLGGTPEMTMMKTVYMPIFRDEFKAATGNDFDISKFRSDEKYRSDNLQAIKDANAVASNEVQKIIGSGSRFGARREIKIPFSGKTIPLFGKDIKNIDADTPTGQIISFMGGYPYREQKEFWNGFKEVAERWKEGEGIGALRSLRKPLAVSINMLVYAYMGQVVRTIAAQIKGEEEEKKQEKQLEDKFTTEGLSKTVAGQAINIASAKYGAIGSTISKSALAIAAYNTKDEAVKKKIRDIAKENFYGLSPDIDKITSKNKFAANEAIKKYEADLIPALGVISEGVTNASGTVMDIADISKKVANGENVTDEEKELWQIANTGVNALHILLMTMGGGLPSYYDIKAAVENKAKETNKPTELTD
jgi:hypothetical protein